jgi:hypothetical protein
MLLSSIRHPYSGTMRMLRSASSGMRRLGPSPPVLRAHASGECFESVDMAAACSAQ